MKKIIVFLCLILAGLISFAAPPPPAQSVFNVAVKAIDANTFSLTWQIKDGYFLYKDRIRLALAQNSNVNLAPIILPEAESKTDKQGKTQLIYAKTLTIMVSVLGTEPGESLLTAHYQGCSAEGFCYPPQFAEIKLTVDNQLALSDVVLESHDLPAPVTQELSEHDKITQLLFGTNNILIMLSFYGFGLLLAFTPCVLPMVPVLSGIIVGHGHAISTRKAFLLSLSYVVSMSISYAIVGAVVAMMGSNLQVMMQSPWVLTLFSLVFVLLALSMFNFYELRLPVAFQAKLASFSRSHSTGHYLGAALMGCLSTLILSPCVTAPLIGALSYIAQSGNVALGTGALFFLGLGMGTPLLLIGTSAGKILPKAGNWMNAVKAFFGVMLLAVAIYLLQRVLPTVLTMLLWASLLIFSSIFLGALTKAESHQQKFCQALGIMLFAYGLLILVGASLGYHDPFKPLAPLAKQHATTQTQSPLIKTLADAKQALNEAKGKPVMLDFYADWCTSCKVIASTTLKNKRIKKILHNVVVLTLDITANNRDSQDLLHYFHVVAPPTFLFFDTEGHELADLRLVGEVSTQHFYNKLELLVKING